MAKLNVFISYAHEDAPIAEALREMLRDSFGDEISVFVDTCNLHVGDDITDALKIEIKNADTLLVISTGVVRATHSWTGFELGYFAATHPTSTGMRGKVISICTHDHVPATEEARRYVPLKIENELLATDQARPGENISVDDSDDLLQLLSDFVLEIEKVALSEKRARRDECRKHVIKFKMAVVALLKTRIKEVRKPQKQFLVRYNLKDADASREDLPPDAVIISIGGALALFGIPDNHPALSDMDAREVLVLGSRKPGSVKARGMKWEEFRKLIAKDTLALHWGAALSEAVLSATSFTDADNSQVIITHDAEKRFRIIVTTSTTFYDGTVETSVYLVEALKRKDYGRPDTTLLLKGLYIVCRFRFLLLESQSDFYWFNLDGWGTARLPKMARQLLIELNLLQTESRDAELHKPGTWAAFVPISGLEAMMKTWRPLNIEIRKLCLEAMQATDEAALAKILEQLKAQLKLVAEQVPICNATLLRAMAAKLVDLAGTTQDNVSL